jgi:3',5'-cyclic AMP phosphodiesterase CpdA
MSGLLLHLSDPHFGAMDPRVADAFLAQAATMRPDVTVLSGDLTMRARRRELTDSLAFTKKLPKPLLVIPGNHDIPALNQPFDRIFRPFERYRRWFGEDLEPEYHAADLSVVGLNSSRAFSPSGDWSLGRLCARQLAELPERFARAVPGALRVLTLHHPLIAPPGHHRAIIHPIAGLKKALAEAKVDLVLCGHFHVSMVAPIDCDGWTAMVSQAGTVCSTRLQGEPQGFHEIRYSRLHLSVTIHTFDGTRFIPTASPDYGRSDGAGWHVISP